ncbi:Carbonic anhydrase [uncultured archaeon]|nr:Carbonic anhydrase [uncultured archaeon]
MDFIDWLLKESPKIRLGELDEEQKWRVCEVLSGLQAGETLEDGRTLAFLVPLYLRALDEGHEKARRHIEALAAQIGGQPASKTNRPLKLVEKTSERPIFATKKDAKNEEVFRISQSRPMPENIRQIEEKVKNKIMPSPQESREDLQWRNGTHREQVAALGPVEGQEITELVITCADARLGGMVKYQDFKDGTRILYVAGNVAEVLQRPEMKAMLEKLAAGARITVVGHTLCGAVTCACHAEKYAGMDQIPELISKVGLDPRDNVKMQMEKIMEMPGFRERVRDGSLRVVGLLMRLEDQKMEIIHGRGRTSRKDLDWAGHLESNFRGKNAGKDLAEHQYAPVAIVRGSSLKVSGREIFDLCEANRAFCVTASSAHAKGKKAELDKNSLASVEMAMTDLLDDHALASVQYAITNNSTRHVVLIDTDAGVMDAWKKEMMERSPIIRRAVEEGLVVIDRFLYHESTGWAEHLPDARRSAA